MFVEKHGINVILDTRSLTRASIIPQRASDRIKKAISLAIDRANQSFGTQTVRQTAKRYFIKQNELREHMMFYKSYGGSPYTGGVSFMGRRKRLGDYSIRPRKAPLKPGSFRGAVMKAGGLKPIPLAFFVNGVPAIRDGSRLRFLLSPSIPQIVQNRETTNEARIKAQDTFEQRLRHELKRAGILL